jgi:hypothetical protein
MDAQALRVAPEIAPYAKATGIIALILAIAGILIPVFGVLFITPLAIIFGAIALYGGSKSLGIAVIVLVAINLIISPTFWLNVGAAATQADATGNRLLAYFDVVGLGVMIYLAARKARP